MRVLLALGLLTAVGLAQGRRDGSPTLLLAQLDGNRNGKVSVRELAAGFRRLDRDGDGRLTSGEIDARLLRLDTNRDGALSPKELKRGAAGGSKQPRADLPDPDAGLPKLVAPKNNPVTSAKAVLGKMLFWDDQLSSDDTVACGSCHVPAAGGADPRPVRHPEVTATGSAGIRAQVTRRASPSFFGSLYSPTQFWDGRARSLEAQAIVPILNPEEMAHPGRMWRDVTRKLARSIPLANAKRLTPDIVVALAEDPTYPRLFARAFRDEKITDRRIAFALASYERTLVPDRTPWDRFVAGDTTALTERQRRGWNDFRTIGCAVCHAPPFFTDHTLRSIGVGDGKPVKVPSLRNVGLRRTFMHNGEFTSLRAVLGLYRGPRRGAEVDPLLRGGLLRNADVPALLDFLLNALTDPRAERSTAPFDHPALR